MKRDPNEHTELKITLSQAQCDALAEEAKAKGVKFFDHCRTKLLANMTTEPVKSFEERHTLPLPSEIMPTPEQPDRIDRLEAMMMQMAETIQNLANPQHIADGQLQVSGTETDMETIIRNRMAEAESQGLTAARPAQQHEEPDDSDYRTIGVRRFNRPAPPNFSSLGSSGRIQREGTPTSGA